MGRFSSGLIRKTVVMGLVFALALLGASVASAALPRIDNFNNCGSAGGCDKTLDPTFSEYWYSNHGGALGGQRELYCSAPASNAGTNPVTCGMANQIAFPTKPPMLLGIADGGDAATFDVLWDGNQASPASYVNDLGLGGLDLTDSGTRNVFRLNYSSNNALATEKTVRITVYDTLSDYSYYELSNIPDTTTFIIPDHKDYDILFDDFIDVGGGADFTSVNAVEMSLIAEDAIVLSVDVLSVQAEIVGYASWEIVEDMNSDGDIDSGASPAETDVVEYTVVLTNVDDMSNAAVSGLTYDASFSVGGSLVDGTVTTSQGTVTTGNTNGDTTVEVDVGSLSDGDEVTIVYQVKIDTGVADLTNYPHNGSFSTSTGLTSTAIQPLNPLTYINLFDFASIMTVAAKDDADGDGYPGPNERVTFTNDITNNRSTGRKFHFWQYEFSNADIIYGSVSAAGMINEDGLCEGCIRRKRNSTSGMAFQVIFDARVDASFPFYQFGAEPAYIEAQSVITNHLTAGLDLSDASNFEYSDDDVEAEADATRIRVDAFPNHIAASVDNDKDGLPDEWNSACNTTCQDDSGLTLDLPENLNDTDNDGQKNDADTDDDGDGVLDVNDDFPYHEEASVDSDGDGQPDAFHPSCDATCQSNSDLTLDDDRDGDGVLDVSDDFPDDPSVALDTDGDGMADEYVGTCDATCQSASGQTIDTDDDNDGVSDGSDAFPLDCYASVDFDSDGDPNDLHDPLPAGCSGGTALVADSDDDDDGTEDTFDSFPLNEYAADDLDIDGMPDAWVSASGCNEVNLDALDGCQFLSGLTEDPFPNDTDNDGTPNDPGNDNADDDGDGIPNGSDADDFNDNNPPVVTPPANLEVIASGELTTVALGTASAEDALDGSLTATPDNTGPFALGVHTITWSATDAAGNTGTATQTVTVVEETALDDTSSDESSSSGGGSGKGGSLGYLALFLMLLAGARRKIQIV
jgi:hypothetical protein